MPRDVAITTSGDDPLVSAAEAARALGVSTVTIQRWARDGSIAAEKMPGRTGAYLLRQSEVERVRIRRRTDADALLKAEAAS